MANRPSRRSIPGLPAWAVTADARQRGYTLIEIMVVTAIVVLMLGMAIPVFRAISGTRSEAGASNMIAAMLARSRADAIGLQKPMGIAVIYNPSQQKTYVAEVDLADAQPAAVNTTIPAGGYCSLTISSAYPNTYYFRNNTGSPQTVNATWSQPSKAGDAYGPLTGVGGPPVDLVADTDTIILPAGVSAQTICNSTMSSGTVRSGDGYLSLGVILFDGHGRLTTQNYGIAGQSNLLRAESMAGTDYPNVAAGQYSNNTFGMISQYGLVVFQAEAFTSQNFPTVDPAYGNGTTTYTGGSPSQQQEENWLDQNATPLLINRYTGTLVKSE